MPGSSPYPSDGGPLLLPADGGLLAGRMLGRSRHHPQTRGVCVWFFGGLFGCRWLVDSCSDVSSMDGFTMLMFQFHVWVQGKLLGESYLFHPCSSSSIDSLGLLRLNLRCQGDGMLIFWCHPYCHKWPVQVFWVELIVLEDVWGINMCRFRSNRTNHSGNYFIWKRSWLYPPRQAGTVKNWTWTLFGGFPSYLQRSREKVTEA